MQVSTDFPGGGADNLRIDGDTVSFEAPAKGCPQPMWFAFRLLGAAGRRVTGRLTNGRACLGGGQLGVAQPVYRDGAGAWHRVMPQRCSYDAASGVLTFWFTPTSDETTVASIFPYQLADLDAFRRKLPADRARWRVLGESPHGRPIAMLEVGDPERRGEVVWVTARHHAGEVQGSYVIEGLVSRVLSAPWLLAGRTFCCLPIMDVDAVEEGSYGKDQAPIDFNRDWSESPHHPAVRMVQRELAASAASGTLTLFLDLHGPAPGDPSFFLPSRRWTCDDAYAQRCFALIDHVARDWDGLAQGDYPRQALRWAEDNAEMVSAAAVELAHGVPALTLEVAYHRDHLGRLQTPEGWRGIGRRLAEGYHRWRLSGEASGRVRALPELPRPAAWFCQSLPQQVAISDDGADLVLTSTAAPARARLQLREFQSGPRRLTWQSSGKATARLSLYRYGPAGYRLPGHETVPLAVHAGELRLDPGGRWRCAVLLEAAEAGATWRLRWEETT
ncbi:MAG: hypothetical protein IT204_08100 [Fimbriimonadaceae bacterium]|nr:hypothetical protein [Fimbriimonadaceae bacterium]